MNFSMTPKDNPTDDPGRGYETARRVEGRVLAADRPSATWTRRLAGQDGGEFNIIGYAADVWAWDDTPETMTPEESKEGPGLRRGEKGPRGRKRTSSRPWRRRWTWRGSSREARGAVRITTRFFLTDGRATLGVNTTPKQS